MLAALRRHWPEYLMEAAGIGLWMVAAGILTTVLEHPASAIHQAVGDVVLRRGALGIALGLVSIGLIYSPWGQQSGAHLNPVITLTFFRVGKIEPWDCAFYFVAQFAGALVGILVLARLLDPA